MSNVHIAKRAASYDAALGVNNVLRNTYGLLGMTLVFSAIMAYISMTSNAHVSPLAMIGYFALLFGIHACKNSGFGIVLVFALTGLMGYTLGPVLNMYVNTFSNGGQIIMTAFGGTGIIFFALSAYVLTTRQNLSFMGGTMMVMSMVLLMAIIASMFFHMPMLQLMISAGFVLFSSAAILYETSNIIHGGERNYILATVSLYVSLFNLFLSLLHILSALSGRRD